MEKEPIDNLPISHLEPITLYTDHIPTKGEILEARKKRLRDLGYGK